MKGVAELTWVKSTYSSGEGGQCVEVALGGAPAVHVRDSKDTARPGLAVDRDAWAAFVGYAGERAR
ncbi:DUF397 domain-containing protein [Streptomyces sp. NBC_00670]|uniref:DUF397 domain-containing protein n=1 Tax=Streptomyces sp. NBC_00670 TaxID=2975804 RepID=UPI002E3050BA|nr:DUF397 domain-containing protein [Streptomyces sp. NBC_00670]